jgi:hypothetical protein
MLFKANPMVPLSCRSSLAGWYLLLPKPVAKQYGSGKILTFLQYFTFYTQRFRNQNKILSFFILFCEEKVYRSYKHFFLTLKPNVLKKESYQILLRFFFYIYTHVNPFHFLKKNNYRCTLLATSPFLLVYGTSCDAADLYLNIRW